MSSTTNANRAPRLERRRHAEAEYRIIFALSFAFFLIAVLVARSIRLMQSPLQRTAASGKTLFEEARDAAHSTLPYAFMG